MQTPFMKTVARVKINLEDMDASQGRINQSLRIQDASLMDQGNTSMVGRLTQPPNVKSPTFASQSGSDFRRANNSVLN